MSVSRGVLYAVDDANANTGSIGGKVSSLVDQAVPNDATGIIWSSNENGSASSDVDYTTILSIDDTSTTAVPSPITPPYPLGIPAYTACNGAFDGACDSSNILSYYNVDRAQSESAPTPVNYYAASLCTATINDYSDWYLPAICELNAVNSNAYLTCPIDMQSMVGNLSFLIGNSSASMPNTSCNPLSNIDCLAGVY